MLNIISRSKHLFGLAVLVALAATSGAGLKWGTNSIIGVMDAIIDGLT